MGTVARRYSVRSLLRDPQGLVRHRALKYLTCNGFFKPFDNIADEVQLMCFIYVFLGLNVFSILMTFLSKPEPPQNYVFLSNEHWHYMPHHHHQFWRFMLEQKGIIPVGLVAVAVIGAVVCLLLRSRRRRTLFQTPQRKEDELKTISALVQQV